MRGVAGIGRTRSRSSEDADGIGLTRPVYPSGPVRSRVRTRSSDDAVGLGLSPGRSAIYDVPLSSAAAATKTYGERRASLPSMGGRARSATVDASVPSAGPPPSPLLGPADGRGGRPRSMSESGADEPSLLLPSGDFAPSGATAAGPDSANPKLYAADDFEPPHKGCCSAEQMSFWQSVLTRLPAIHIVSNALMLYVIGPLYMYDFVAPIIVLLWFYGSLRFYRLWGFCAIGAQYLLENDSRNPHYWTDRSDKLDAHNAKKRKDRLREMEERERAALAASAEVAEQGFDTREQRRDAAAVRRDSATRRGSGERASAGGGRQRRRTESDCANPHVPRVRDRACSDIPPIAADIVHVAIIPNYKEPLYKLKQTIDTLVTQSVAHRVIVVMGMEDRDEGAAQTALRLRFEYAGRLLGFYWTSHTLQEGEIPGKSSNLNWAARCLTMALRKHNVALDRVMLTVADADTFFHPNYFAMLSHKHVEEPNRDYTIWNSANTFAPNSLDVPAICSVRFMVISLGRLSELANPGGNHFPFAVYSLPLTLAMRAGYWDPATIPEDWHMCIRVHFHTSQHVRCKPLWLATGSDCVATEHWWDSIKEAYYQSVRWSYGAVDYGYIITSIFSHWNVGAFRKLRLFLRAFEVHVLFPLMFMALSSAPLYSQYEVRLTVPAWLDPTYVPRNVIGAPPPPARQLSVSFGQLQAALGLPTLFIHWFLICVFDYLYRVKLCAHRQHFYCHTHWFTPLRWLAMFTIVPADFLLFMLPTAQAHIKLFFENPKLFKYHVAPKLMVKTKSNFNLHDEKAAAALAEVTKTFHQWFRCCGITSVGGRPGERQEDGRLAGTVYCCGSRQPCPPIVTVRKIAFAAVAVVLVGTVFVYQLSLRLMSVDGSLSDEDGLVFQNAGVQRLEAITEQVLASAAPTPT